MELTSLERDMPVGKIGEGTASAMKVQFGTGKAFFAKRMVPTIRAHVEASARDGGVCFVARLVDLGARRLVSPTNDPNTDVGSVDEHYRSQTDEGRERVEMSSGACRRIGATLALGCTRELEKKVPAFGEAVAFSEFGATPYVDPVFYDEVEDGDHIRVDAVAGKVMLTKVSAASDEGVA